MVKVIGEIVDCLPIDSVLSQVPEDLLPDNLKNGVKQKDLREKLCKVLSHMLEIDEN
jgi:hypothetical protein